MDIQHSRPVRIVTPGNNIKVYGAATKVSSFALTPQRADVYVQFTDGPGGQILWEAEADASSGTHFENFGGYPLLFKKSVYVNLLEDGEDALKSLSVGLVLPASAGTS